MNATQILTNGQPAEKPIYLFEEKEEIIAERDRMEANWNESMRSRMTSLAQICYSKFGVMLSNLA